MKKIELQIYLPDHAYEFLKEYDCLPKLSGGDLSWVQRQRLSTPSVKTIKTCPGFVRYQQCSLSILNPYNLEYTITEDGQFEYYNEHLFGESEFTVHPTLQFDEFASDMVKRNYISHIIKMNLPFQFKLKEKNTCLTGVASDPFWNSDKNLNIDTIPGIFDFNSRFIIGCNIFFAFKNIPGNHTIPAGKILQNITIPIPVNKKLVIKYEPVSMDEFMGMKNEQKMAVNFFRTPIKSFYNMLKDKKWLNK